MLDEEFIATLEVGLRETRNAQNRLMGRLREAENEVELLRQEINALENSAVQTEVTIDRFLLEMRRGSRQDPQPRIMTIDDEYGINRSTPPQFAPARPRNVTNFTDRANTVTYINQHRNVPTRTTNKEPLSQRFSDLTITQSCTLLLREAGRSLHVNEIYNLLVAGGMKFKGANPTISIAVSLSRNSRFRKVDPGTFDIAMREAGRKAS